MSFFEHRAKYQPNIPENLKNLGQLQAKVMSKTLDTNGVENFFTKTHSQPIMEVTAGTSGDSGPLKVGVVLSGGQAPGGHNVIAGIFDGLKSIHKDCELIGFTDGPAGIISNKFMNVDQSLINQYKNTGGFDMLGSGRTKIETPEQFKNSKQTVLSHNLDGLVIIGGDDSNTNAALLAEYFEIEGVKTRVIGVPKTIDGDLKNDFVETSFGFDTAVKLYAEIISNIGKDILSSKKYYHFIRLMGRAASHIAVEAALLTHPNMVLISEEIAEKNIGLDKIIDSIADLVVARSEDNKNYGIILIPEGLIEFIPEMRTLIDELNDVLGLNEEYIKTLHTFTDLSEYLNHKLTKETSYTLSSLPIDIQRQLLLDRDPHGNVQVSCIETEKLLIELLERKLGELKANKKYTGQFKVQHHFLGYEGRCAAPSNFDADYAYSLGLNASALIRSGLSGYMSVVQNLAGERKDWKPLGVPLTAMMNIEKRSGKEKPVIKKGLLDLKGPVFEKISNYREKWAKEDDYRFVGAIQYFGPSELCDQVPKSLRIEHIDGSKC